jgi:hypothetical protein
MIGQIHHRLLHCIAADWPTAIKIGRRFDAGRRRSPLRERPTPVKRSSADRFGRDRWVEFNAAGDTNCRGKSGGLRRGRPAGSPLAPAAGGPLGTITVFPKSAKARSRAVPGAESRCSPGSRPFGIGRRRKNGGRNRPAPAGRKPVAAAAGRSVVAEREFGIAGHRFELDRY